MMTPFLVGDLTICGVDPAFWHQPILRFTSIIIFGAHPLLCFWRRQLRDDNSVILPFP